MSCDYSDHRARPHHVDSDQDSSYLRGDRRHMLWGCQRTFLSTDHYQYINARLESVSGCSFRTRGISPHILPNWLLHMSKNRLRETVSSECRSLTVRRPSLHKIPSSFISSLQPLLRSSYPWQCPFCISLTGSPPSSPDIQTEHTPKSEPISSQSRGNVVAQNTQAISQSYWEP